jgi:hypothetical protein
MDAATRIRRQRNLSQAWNSGMAKLPCGFRCMWNTTVHIEGKELAPGSGSEPFEARLSLRLIKAIIIRGEIEGPSSTAINSDFGACRSEDTMFQVVQHADSKRLFGAH